MESREHQEIRGNLDKMEGMDSKGSWVLEVRLVLKVKGVFRDLVDVVEKKVVMERQVRILNVVLITLLEK